MIGDAKLCTLAAGQTVDLVVCCDGTQGGVAACFALWTEDRYIVDHASISPGVWTLYDFTLEAVVDGCGVLRPNEDAAVFPRREVDRSAFYRFREVCAGMGGLAMGASRAGCTTVAFVDKSPLACAVLAENGGLVIQGDIAERSTRIALHAAGHAERSILAAGFPCQPYSVQGSRGGLQYSRGLVLPQILHTSWLLQSCGLVLECVGEVENFPETMSLLRKFAVQCGFRLRSVVLDLQHQWCSRRRRWWGLMLPADMPQFELPPWPVSDCFAAVRDVSVEWPVWSEEEESSLQWTPAEAEMYGSSEFGASPRLLDIAGPAPTLVHSYGNALGHARVDAGKQDFRCSG